MRASDIRLLEQGEVNALIIERLENIKEDTTELKQCQSELYALHNDLNSRVIILETKDRAKSKWIYGIGIATISGIVLAIFGLILDVIT